MTAPCRFVAYYRVSTQQQGRSGLGLAAQQEAVQKHVGSIGGELVDAKSIKEGKFDVIEERARQYLAIVAKARADIKAAAA